jgi:lipopolysaccharide exporter
MTDVTKRFMYGSILSILNKSGNKLVGMLSTLILVRLLLPEDFGVIAITLMIINVTESLSNLGPANYIIQKKDLIDSDVDTAWTLALLLKTIISGSLILLAPVFSTFFDTPSLTTTLPLLALGMVIAGFGSPKVFVMGRNMEYVIPFKISISQKITSASGTVIAAFIFRDYRALVVGHLLSTISYLISSYYFAYQKPSFTLINFKNQWLFSKWVVKSAVTGQIRGNIDTGFAAKFIGAAFVGPYQIMKYYSSLPVSFFIQPLLTPLVAAFSKLKDNTYHFNKQIEKVCLLMGSLSLIMFIGLHGMATTVVFVIFGDNWVEYTYIFKTFSYLLIVTPLSICFAKALMSMGKVKSLFVFDIGSLGLLVCIIGTMILFAEITSTNFIYVKVGVDFFIALCLCIYAFNVLALVLNIFWVKFFLLYVGNLLFYFFVINLNYFASVIIWKNELIVVSIALLFNLFVSLILFKTEFKDVFTQVKRIRSN